MDDLRKLPLVGAATAKKLEAAGLDTFAKVAAATVVELGSVIASANPAELDTVIAAASKLAPKPIDLSNATAEEIAAQAAKIEAARLQISQWADAAVLAFGNLKGLAKDAPESEFHAAETAFDDAIASVHDAIAEARALLGVPEEMPLPAALQEELSPLQNLPPFVPRIAREAASIDVAESADAETASLQELLEWTAGASFLPVLDGTFEETASAAWDFVRPKLLEMGREKGYAGVWSHGFRQGWMAAERPNNSALRQVEQTPSEATFNGLDEAHKVLADIIAGARAAAAAGELAEASQFLRDQRTDIRAAQVSLAEMLEGINAEIEALDLIQSTAPVEHGVEVKATVDSRWRIGRQFSKEPTPFEPGELAADELEALKVDPLLIVTEIR